MKDVQHYLRPGTLQLGALPPALAVGGSRSAASVKFWLSVSPRGKFARAMERDNLELIN
jgi:hypothetical protein